MTANFDSLLSDIASAGESGFSLSKLKTIYIGKDGEKAKAREAELRDRLTALTREGAIRGPFKRGASQLYFAAGRGPTIEKVAEVVARLVLLSGVKLLSKSTLEKKVTGLDKAYFADALSEAVARRTIMEVACGNSKCFVHRNVAAERFGFETGTPSVAKAEHAPQRRVSFADLLPAYRRLKAEQGGFTAVKIFDLIQALDAPKAEVHRLLAEEAKAGRVTLHPSTSVELPQDVVDAAIRLPGHAEPFVTVVVKEDR